MEEKTKKTTATAGVGNAVKIYFKERRIFVTETENTDYEIFFYRSRLQPSGRGGRTARQPQGRENRR